MGYLNTGLELFLDILGPEDQTGIQMPTTVQKWHNPNFQNDSSLFQSLLFRSPQYTFILNIFLEKKMRLLDSQILGGRHKDSVRARYVPVIYANVPCTYYVQAYLYNSVVRART